MRVYRTVTSNDHENVQVQLIEKKKNINNLKFLLSIDVKYRHCTIKHHYIIYYLPL